jgi:glucose/arabinose dehydrogenase
MRLKQPAGIAALAIGLLSVTACGSDTAQAAPDDSPDGTLACAQDDGGMALPDGFCAVVVADGIGAVRHMAVAANGDLYVSLRSTRSSPGRAIALRDTTGDGVADVTVAFDDAGGTGIELWNGWVYVGHDDGVVRYRRPAGQLAPDGDAEVIVQGLRSRGGHAAKPVEITSDGKLFVNIGSPSNSCQEQDRRAGSPGIDPCDQRETNAGIWRFDAETRGQTQADGEHFATGMRNTVALHYDDVDGALYAAIHGRDQLAQNWGDLYTEQEGAELPAEEFVRVSQGDDYGWPYCYYDQRQGKKVLAPEYGGDGSEVGRCADMDLPLFGFPGHWAPNDLTLYHGDQFPDRYRDGVFIAFHGSWNRAPLPQEGAKVVFLPRDGDGFADTWEDFATGRDDWAQTREHRPTGLAVGPDGSLYISDDAGGRIWRVIYQPAR